MYLNGKNAMVHHMTVCRYHYMYTSICLHLYVYGYMYPCICIRPSIHLSTCDTNEYNPLSPSKKKMLFSLRKCTKAGHMNTNPKTSWLPKPSADWIIPHFPSQNSILFLQGAAWQSTALQALVEKPAKGQTFQATWKIHLLQIAIEEASQ